MAIEWAKEDAGTDYTATVDELRDQIIGFPLAEITADAEAQARLLERTLSRAKTRWARRCFRFDFNYHTAVEAEFDGTDIDKLYVNKFGFCPLLAVTDITISSSTVAATSVDPTAVGVVQIKPLVSTTDYQKAWPLSIWSVGVKNVAMTLTWGYSSAFMGPSDARTDQGDDLVYAQCLMAEQMLLRRIRRSANSQYGVAPGYETERRASDVYYSARGGRYSYSLGDLAAELREIETTFRNGAGIIGSVGGTQLSASGALRW